MDDVTSVDTLSDKELSEKLLSLAKAIKDQTAEIPKHAQTIASWTAAQTAVRKQILEKVEEEKDPETGKLAFSNKEKREEETDRRCYNHPEWANLNGKIREEAKKRSEAELGLEYMDRIFKIMLAEFRRRTKDNNYVIIKEAS